MKKTTYILSLAITAALASAVALAQPASPTPAKQKPAAQKPAAQKSRIDADGDAVITRAEAARAPRLAERFDRLDANKDGRLAGDELPQRGNKAGMRGRMQALDTDKDRRISKAEAQAAKGGLAQRFDALDANKDGYLDKADTELRMRERREQAFTRADTDGNGVLSREEFLAIKPMAGPMHGGRGGHGPRHGPRHGQARGQRLQPPVQPMH